MWRKKCNWKNIFFRLNYWQELLMCEFISQDVTLNSDTLIMSEFIVACFAWSAALSIGVLLLQSPSAVKGIITFLFVIYHDAKILFVKTLEILLPAVVSGYQWMSWSASGWSENTRRMRRKMTAPKVAERMYNWVCRSNMPAFKIIR